MSTQCWIHPLDFVGTVLEAFVDLFGDQCWVYIQAIGINFCRSEQEEPVDDGSDVLSRFSANHKTNDPIGLSFNSIGYPSRIVFMSYKTPKLIDFKLTAQLTKSCWLYGFGYLNHSGEYSSTRNI